MPKPSSFRPKPPVPPSEPKAPGQHEDILARIDKGFKDVLDALKAHGTGDSTIVVQLDTSVQNHILGIVKDIRKHQVGAGGLTPAEEDALATKLDASSTAVQGAVEANQPNQPKP
jgi:hypothetical protein